ncbi:MAG TPA: hypothetical protein VGM90_29140 [Kofleriaceae bacterium]|jgi:hypothetical protein
MKKVVSIAALALVFSCSGKKTEPAATGSGSGSGSAPAPAKVEPPAKGLAAKDNDPAIVALAKEGIKCKADGDRLEWNCDGFKAWRDSKLFEDNKGDATLTNLLEDPDEKVRSLAVDRFQHLAPKDPAQVKRMLAAAQLETSTIVAEWLGRSLGAADVAKAGVAADANKLIADSKSPELRNGLITGGASNAAYFDTILEVGNESTDVKLRHAAVEAFYNNTPEGKEADVCKMWLGNVDNADAETAGAATSLEGRVGSCKDNYDALLDKIDARQKNGTIANAEMVSSLHWLNDGSSATDAQKKRAIDLGKAIASNEKLPQDARGGAVELLAPIDATYTAKFLKDKDDYVKGVAERALKK